MLRPRADQTPALPGLLLAGIGGLLMWLGRKLEQGSASLDEDELLEAWTAKEDA